MRAMCGSAAHWDFASQNKEDKLPEPAATRLLTQLVSFASQTRRTNPLLAVRGSDFASQNKEDKSSAPARAVAFASQTRRIIWQT